MPKPQTIRDVIQSLLPEGSIWNPKPGGGELDYVFEDSSGDLVIEDSSGELVYSVESSLGFQEDGYLDAMLKGMSDNHHVLMGFLDTLGYIREPRLTAYLEDLEREYGLITITALSEQERRDILHAIVYAPEATGTYEFLEDQLNEAGFAVQVHQNNPSVDPWLFYGGAGGEMITNNKFYDRTITEARKVQALWGSCFFIGGNATRDSDGKITAISRVLIASELKPSFREIVLKYKPLFSWGIAVINDSEYFSMAHGDAKVTSTTKGFANEARTNGGFWFDNEA